MTAPARLRGVGRRAFFVRSLAAILLALFAASQSPDAGAATMLSPYRRWFPQELPRKLYVDPRGRPAVNDPDHGLTATLTRIEGWEDASGVGDLLKPIKGSPTDPAAVPAYSSGDGISVLRFDDPAFICRGSCLAATTTGGIDFSDVGQCGGFDWYRWTDADICFNPGGGIGYTTEYETDSGDACVGEYYLESVALHEVGHLLALGHSGHTEAVMYAYASACDRAKVFIQADDATGISRPYACAFSKGGVYADSDGDGYGQDADCDDQDPGSHPGAVEVCDLADNDCDGTGEGPEGLSCSDVCLDAAGGIDGLIVRKGVCTGRIPGRRYVYARGAISDLAEFGGSQTVSIVDCPLFTIYDRVSESTAIPAGGTGWDYLVRNDGDPDYGAASDGTPRTPVELGCP